MNCFSSQAGRSVVSHGDGGFVLDEGLQLAEFDEGGEETNPRSWNESRSPNC